MCRQDLTGGIDGEGIGISIFGQEELKDIAMNCQSCSLKQICDEVEGMRELHFGAVQAQ